LKEIKINKNKIIQLIYKAKTQAPIKPTSQKESEGRIELFKIFSFHRIMIWEMLIYSGLLSKRNTPDKRNWQKTKKSPLKISAVRCRGTSHQRNSYVKL
jgi:hypothetical protein